MSRSHVLRASAVAAVLNFAFTSSALAGVVAQWNMDNDFGTIMTDSSGNGNDGTLYNVTTSGSGYMFDGTSSKVVVPNSASLTPGTQDFSYTVQLQTDRIPPQGTDYDVLRKGTSIKTGGEYKLEIVYNDGIGKAYCVVKDAEGHIATKRGTTNVADGQLHTITCTKTSTGLTLQVDDLPPLTKAATLTGPISNSKPLTLGVKTPSSTGTAGDWFFGTMRSATVSVGP